MTEAEATAQKYDADEIDLDKLQMRFALELFANAGDNGLTDDELSAAWERMDELLTIHTMIALWLDGTLESAWFLDQQELGFRLSTFGREVAQHVFPDADLGEFGEFHNSDGEVCDTCRRAEA